jgi:DNA-binding HxlR family transcriptional regulator
MARKSARVLGKQVGLTARTVNLLLEKLGYLQKSKYYSTPAGPNWELTDEGRRHGEPSKHPYSAGFIWDDDVLDQIEKIQGDF